MSLIAVKDLSVRYGAQTVLSHVDMSVEPGEIVTIVGPNGSGKTSLFKAIIGAIEPGAGQITRRAGLRIGYVPQRLHIDQTLPITVERFLRLGGKISRKACQDALSAAGVADLLKRQMTGLSGGQFQRVLLARALIGGPRSCCSTRRHRASTSRARRRSTNRSRRSGTTPAARF